MTIGQQGKEILGPVYEVNKHGEAQYNGGSRSHGIRHWGSDAVLSNLGDAEGRYTGAPLSR